MKILKNVLFLLVLVTWVFHGTPIALAQAEPNTDNDLFMPLVTNARAGGGNPADLVATKVISPEEQQATIAYWTRDAIATAKPMALPAQMAPAQVDAAALAEPAVSGPPVVVPPGAAAPDANQVAQTAYPQDWAALADEAAATVEAAAVLAPDGSSQVYTSYIVNGAAVLQTLYPHRWIGRLSFRLPDGSASFCSGTSIRGNVMLTAAHCLYDSTTNRWFSNWVFTPAYRNGNAPFGTFVATQCWVLNSWINLTGGFSINTWAPNDVGVCRMGTNSADVTLNNAVGFMGYQANMPTVRHFHNLGYPLRDYTNALLPNAGAFLRTCVAESFLQATEVRGMGCNLGGGISGGPWMVGYAPGVVTGVVDSVNSGLFFGSQNLYGGRFNNNNIIPLCRTAGC
jgi:V8-like Glu-specific endopeptidase